MAVSNLHRNKSTHTPSQQVIGLSLAANRLFGLGSAALSALATRTGNVVVRDPALIDFASGDGDVLGRVGEGIGVAGLSGLLGGALGSSLGEQSFDPGLVDKVESCCKGASQDEVQEDTIKGTKG